MDIDDASIGLDNRWLSLSVGGSPHAAKVKIDAPAVVCANLEVYVSLLKKPMLRFQFSLTKDHKKMVGTDSF